MVQLFGKLWINGQSSKETRQGFGKRVPAEHFYKYLKKCRSNDTFAKLRVDEMKTDKRDYFSLYNLTRYT